MEAQNNRFAMFLHPITKPNQKVILDSRFFFIKDILFFCLFIILLQWSDILSMKFSGSKISHLTFLSYEGIMPIMTAWWCLGVPLQILTPLLEGVTPLWTLLRRSCGEWRIIIQGYVNVRKIMQSNYGNRIQLHCASFHCIFIVDTTHQTTFPLNVLSSIILIST